MDELKSFNGFAGRPKLDKGENFQLELKISKV